MIKTEILKQHLDTLLSPGSCVAYPGPGAFLTPDSKTLFVVFRDEWLDEKKLPIKYAGISSCFRQEVVLYLVVEIIRSSSSCEMINMPAVKIFFKGKGSRDEFLF
jgi:hypothetical protein